MPLIIGTAPTVVDINELSDSTLTSALMSHGQVVVGSSASTLILGANPGRRWVTLMNNSSVALWIGSSSSLTTMNGLELPIGAALNINRLTEGYTGTLAARSGSALTTLPLISYVQV